MKKEPEPGQFSWIVKMNDGEWLQVNAHFLYPDQGTLIFKNRRNNTVDEGSYTSLVIPAGQYEWCSVMSQATGFQNGFITVDASKA